MSNQIENTPDGMRSLAAAILTGTPVTLKSQDDEDPLPLLPSHFGIHEPGLDEQVSKLHYENLARAKAFWAKMKALNL